MFMKVWDVSSDDHSLMQLFRGPWQLRAALRTQRKPRFHPCWSTGSPRLSAGGRCGRRSCSTCIVCRWRRSRLCSRCRPTAAAAAAADVLRRSRLRSRDERCPSDSFPRHRHRRRHRSCTNPFCWEGSCRWRRWRRRPSVDYLLLVQLSPRTPAWLPMHLSYLQSTKYTAVLHVSFIFEYLSQYPLLNISGMRYSH